MKQDNVINIKILNRNYKVRCEAEETQNLEQAAKYLDKHMRLLQSKHDKGIERIAIIAGINVCHELLQLKHQEKDYLESNNQQLKKLQQRIQESLNTLLTDNN